MEFNDKGAMEVFYKVGSDGKDIERLQQVIDGRVYVAVLEKMLRHLYWWTHEAQDQSGEAYFRAYDFLLCELELARLYVSLQYVGTVVTRAGKTVEKTNDDFREVQARASQAPREPSPESSEDSPLTPK